MEYNPLYTLNIPKQLGTFFHCSLLTYTSSWVPTSRCFLCFLCQIPSFHLFCGSSFCLHFRDQRHHTLTDALHRRWLASQNKPPKDLFKSSFVVRILEDPTYKNVVNYTSSMVTLVKSWAHLLPTKFFPPPSETKKLCVPLRLASTSEEKSFVHHPLFFKTSMGDCSS